MHNVKKESLKQYELKVIANGACCPYCYTPFKVSCIGTNDHKGGMQLEGYDEKQWPGFRCKKCNLVISYWKITGTRDNTVPDKIRCR